MGLFSFIKRRHKNKELMEVSRRYEGEVLFEEQKRNSSDVKRYLVDQCEQLTDAATELSNAKKEYKNITSYLTDIQTIELIEGQDRSKILDSANAIVNLTDARNSMQKKVERLPDSQFYAMDAMKDEILKGAKLLKENEKTQATIKKDLDYLEGEKVEWSYEKLAIKDEQKALTTVIKGFTGSIFALLILFIYLSLNDYSKAENVVIVIMLILAALILVCIIRMQNNKMDIKQCTINYNHAVEIQNSIKLKYVLITNAVDYAHERYHVNNAEELEHDYQMYLEAVKEREKLRETDDDLNYYRASLVKTLRLYRLYDAAIWPYQAEALINPKEMVEVKHTLLERRQKLRNRMDGLNQTVIDTRKQVISLSKDHHIYENELTGILDSVDKILGSET